MSVADTGNHPHNDTASAGGAEFNDPSISALVESDATTLTIPTRLELVGKAAEFISRRAQVCGVCDEEKRDKLILALHEAITNAIVHGNLGISSELKERPDNAFARALAERSADPVLSARRVTLRFTYDGERCDISVSDEGEGFDFEKLIREKEAACAAIGDGEDSCPIDPSMLLNSGRGILIMRAFMDDVRFRDHGREVVLTLKSPTKRERRASARHSCSEPVRVLPFSVDGSEDKAEAWEALVRDVSEDGLALVQAKSHTASRLLVELRDGQRSVLVPAQVCRITQTEDGLYEIGCRFGAPIENPTASAANQRAAPPAVAALLARLEQKDQHDERRAHARVSYTAKIEVQTGGEEFRPAFSRDLSRGGIAFITSYALPLGVVQLRLPSDRPDAQPIRARVVRCQKVTAGVYDVGCQFI